MGGGRAWNYRFFYQTVRAVNSADQDVLQVDDAVEKTDGEEGGPGDAESPGDTDEPDTRRGNLHVWLDAVAAVSDMTKFNWNEVYRMPVIEFFAYIAYVNYRRRKEEQELAKINRKYRTH